MAVQAQYPSNILLLNRNIQDSNDYSLQRQPSGSGFIEQSHMLFNNNGVGGVNPRKRSREFATTTINNNSLNFSPQNCHQHQQQQNQSQNQLIDLSQLQNHHHHHHHDYHDHHEHHQQQFNGVSTGLKLSFGEQNNQIQRPNKVFSLVYYEDFALQFKQQSDELFYFLHSQGEHFRRTLADKRQKHYHAFIGAAEEAISQRLKEKEVELEKASRKNAELEAKAAQLSIQAQQWQAKAQAQEAQAASLKAQLQQAMVGPNKNDSGVGEAEDAESAYVNPISERQVESSGPSCKMCRTRVATMVVLPCRHLCLCTECDNIVQACPICLSSRSASVEVYLT